MDFFDIPKAGGLAWKNQRTGKIFKSWASQAPSGRRGPLWNVACRAEQKWHGDDGVEAIVNACGWFSLSGFLI